MYVSEQRPQQIAAILRAYPSLRDGISAICGDSGVIEPDESSGIDTSVLERIYERAPRGALAVAGTATLLVFALWFAFYLFVFIPRGFLH